ncbi:MAG: hypothetical protein Q7S15_02000 [bacterium]|nr:hypothetical protein [bacterium]
MTPRTCVWDFLVRKKSREISRDLRSWAAYSFVVGIYNVPRDNTETHTKRQYEGNRIGQEIAAQYNPNSKNARTDPNTLKHPNPDFSGFNHLLNVLIHARLLSEKKENKLKP